MTTPLEKLRRYVAAAASEARRLLSDTKVFWIWLGVLLAILIAFYFIPSSTLPDRVRWAGTAFEVLGVVAIVIGISRLRQSFGRPSVLRGMWATFCEFRFILFPRPPIYASASAEIGVTMSVEDDLRGVLAPKTLEERVTELEKRATELQTNLGKLDRKVERRVGELKYALAKETDERKIGDKKVTQRLEEGMIGENPIELAGVAYLFIGLVMANVSNEVATGLQWLNLR